MIPQELVNQTFFYVVNGSPLLLLLKVVAISGHSALVNLTQVNSNTSVMLTFQASIPLYQLWDTPNGTPTIFDGVPAVVQNVSGTVLYVDSYNGLVLAYGREVSTPCSRERQ